MGEEDTTDLPPARQPSSPQRNPSPPTAKFDPSRMIGIIRRKALIKELAAAYHAECLDYCQELLELQRKWEEDLLQEEGRNNRRNASGSQVQQIQSYADIKPPDDLRKDTVRPSKRAKRAR